MPAQLPDDTIRFLKYSPYFALLDGKNDEQTDAFNAKYESLGRAARQFLLSPEAADGIESLVRSGTVPASHAVAVSKLLGMIVMGEVKSEQVATILTKLGLQAQPAGVIAQRFVDMLKPVQAERISAMAAQRIMKPLPPLTQRLSATAPQSSGGEQSGLRNVLDLHQKPRP